MDPMQSRALNQAAYRKMKALADQTYPHGRFIALYGGEIIADAATFRDLEALLKARGLRDPMEVLVFEAGVEDVEYAELLIWSTSP